jgi:hypothetical protein
VDIEILFATACPNIERARARLREALDLAAVAATIRETEVSTPASAACLGMRGSPTILIDGHDPFANGEPASLSCRLYRTDHTVDGAPSVRQLLAAVNRS